jgi:hypothetical protein
MCKGHLDNGEDWVEVAELRREKEMVCPLTDALVNDKQSQTSV